MAKKREPSTTEQFQQDDTGQSQLLYPEQLPTYYSNFASLAVSNRDILIDFGIRQPQLTKEKPQPAFAINNRVIMSLHEGKAFLKILSDAMEKYESTFGKLNLDLSENN